ncbi:hypothetical protein JMJ77_0014132, partial [Colletotrichum scovillei]
MEGVSEGRDISFFPRELMLAMEHHGMRRASGAKKVSWSEWKL